MANEKLIYDILKGKDTLNPSLKKAEKQSTSLTKTLRGTGAAIGGVTTTIKAVPVALGAIAAATGFNAVVSEARELENALVGLGSVAKNTGADVDLAKRAAVELAADGIIPLSEASASLKNLLASGLDLPKAIQLLNAFKDSAAFNRQGQLSLGVAVQRATEGFKNRLSILVDNAGITKNLSQIEREYAAATGKSAKNLDDRQRSLVLANGLIKEAQLFQGDYNKSLNTFEGQVGRVGGEFRFLLADIGKFITGSQQSKAILQDTADVISAIRRLIRGEEVGEVFRESQLEEAENKIDLVKKQIGFLNDELQRLQQQESIDKKLRSRGLEATQDRIKKVKDEIAELGQEYLRLDNIRVANKTFEVFKDPKKAPEVIFEREKQKLIREILEEQKAADEERKRLQIEETAGDTEQQLANLQDQFKKEQDIKRLNNIKDLATEAKNKDQLLKQDQNFRVQIAKRRLDAAKEAQKLQKSQNDLELKQQQDFFSTASSLAQSEVKGLAIIGKAAALTNIAIKTPSAVANSFEFGTRFGGPALGYALGAIAATAMAAQAARIAGASTGGKRFNEGGIISGAFNTGDRNQIPRDRFNNNEVVLNGRQQAQTLFEIANGRRQNNQQSQDMADIVVAVDGREIARVVRDQVKEGYRIGA